MCLDNFHEYYNPGVLEEVRDDINNFKILKKIYVKDREQDFNDEDEDMEKEFARFMAINKWFVLVILSLNY